MAGILGYISFKQTDRCVSGEEFDIMLSAIVHTSEQKTQKVNSGSSWIGWAGSRNDTRTGIYSKNDRTFCVFEGDFSVLPEARNKIIGNNPELSNTISDAFLLPFLYEAYGSSLPLQLTGNFNIFCLESVKNEAILFNGRLGMLPLFFYISDEFLAFGSKLEPLLKSGLIEKKWDRLTQLEQIVFNYPVSDHTFNHHIQTLPSGNCITFNSDRSAIVNYWSVASLFGKRPVSRKSSFETVYTEFEQAIVRGLPEEQFINPTLGLSLTGGWDGRLVLSYMLKNKLGERLLLYSFGAENSTDITIPAKISGLLSIPYQQVVLNNHYISEHFIENALDTIHLSNGHRPFLRTHYLYTMKLMAERTGFVYSGNCGSNILKYGIIKPGTVVNKNLLSLIESKEKVLYTESLFNKYYLAIPDLEASEKDAFTERILPVIRMLNEAETPAMGYYNLLLSRVERKFFGTEQNSYNDYIYNYSPFIDFNFLEALSRTIFWGANYPFNSNSLRLRKLSTDLYSEIIKRNSSFLWNYPTDRDVSFKDLSTIGGKIKILKRKFLTRKPQQGKFHTQSLEDVFKKYFKIDSTYPLEKEESANFISTEIYRNGFSI